MLRGRLKLLVGGWSDDAAFAKLDWRAALERVRGAYADSTLEAHTRDFSVFERWAQGAGEVVLPATPQSVAAFVGATAEQCAIRTVQRRLHVIGRLHQWMGLPDPTKDQAVQLAYRRAMKLRAKPPRQALGLSARMRKELVAACPDTLIGLRDRALIMVGYDTLCRRSELIALQLDDVAPLRKGGGKVLVRRSKNDPEGEGRYAYLSPAAMDALQAWTSAAGISSGPIFRAVVNGQVHSRRLHPRIVNRTLQGAAERAGLPPKVVKQLSGHSMRVGAAQDLAIEGRSVLQIMRAGRWYSLSGMMGYVRKADVNVWSGAEQGRHPAGP